MLTFGKGMTAGMGIAGTVTSKRIRRRGARQGRIPWGGTYSADPLPAAVALKQLQIVIRDNIADHAARVGAVMERRLDGLKALYPVIGDRRGMGLYHMLDIVLPGTKTPDPAMAERIRYNALLEGLALIAVKNFIRICPPLIITEAQVDEAMGRLEAAIRRAMDDRSHQPQFSTSSSLAALEVD